MSTRAVNSRLDAWLAQPDNRCRYRILWSPFRRQWVVVHHSLATGRRPVEHYQSFASWADAWRWVDDQIEMDAELVHIGGAA